MEMENTTGVEPLADIVAGLPGYDYIDTGVIGTDAIRVGIIYKTATVQPVGDYADPRQQSSTRASSTPATVRRWPRPSRRSPPAAASRWSSTTSRARARAAARGDDDTTTGQGNCNGTRTLAAQALADWLATDPTGSGDPDVLIIGDLNSYAKEDPIVALQDAGYTDLVAAFGGPDAYGYVFDGQLGYLDHALANAEPATAGRRRGRVAHQRRRDPALRLQRR